MNKKYVRGPGGKLALWAFWLFCLYFLWNLAQTLWILRYAAALHADAVQQAGTSETAQWLLMLLSLLTFGAVGLILAGIAWYTRPREQ